MPVATYAHTGAMLHNWWILDGLEELRGGYLYGDFCSGSWILKEENGQWSQNYIGSSGGMIVGFGQGLDGELLHSTGQEKLSRLVEKPIFNANHDVLWFQDDDCGRQGV